MPDIDPENIDAEQIYMAVQDQYIMGPAGPVGISQEAIHKAMDLYGIEFRVDCFEKVVNLTRHLINKMYDERRND